MNLLSLVVVIAILLTLVGARAHDGRDVQRDPEDYVHRPMQTVEYTMTLSSRETLARWSGR